MAKNISGTVTRTWDHYVKEASIAPFELQVSDDETITIENPTGAQVTRISEGMRTGDSQVILLGLFGEQFDRVNALLADAPYGVTAALIDDVMDHFKFTADTTMVSPKGERKTVSTTPEIEELRRDGWQVADVFPTSGLVGR